MTRLYGAGKEGWNNSTCAGGSFSSIQRTAGTSSAAGWPGNQGRQKIVQNPIFRAGMSGYPLQSAVLRRAVQQPVPWVLLVQDPTFVVVADLGENTVVRLRYIPSTAIDWVPRDGRL